MNEKDFQKMYKRIKELRAENNLRQEDVADNLGISRVNYNRYENGIHNFPLEILWALADLYDVSLDYLVGRVD